MSGEKNKPQVGSSVASWASVPGRRGIVCHGEMGMVRVTLTWVTQQGGMQSVERAAKAEEEAFKLALAQVPEWAKA